MLASIEFYALFALRRQIKAAGATLATANLTRSRATHVADVIGLTDVILSGLVEWAPHQQPEQEQLRLRLRGKVASRSVLLRSPEAGAWDGAPPGPRAASWGWIRCWWQSAFQTTRFFPTGVTVPAVDGSAACVNGGRLRRQDLATRVGGEEFALLLPNTGLRSAIEVAEAIRKQVAHSGSRMFPHTPIGLR